MSDTLQLERSYRGKRLFDFLCATSGLILLGPLLLGFAIAVWWHDRGSPFYMAPRVGRGGRLFQMIKLRSMRLQADKTGVNSTAADDDRITPVGKIIRAYKLDELMQLVNVVRGDMSLVGPRPQIASDVAFYSEEEKKILEIRPGITDFSSIVFSDEGQILEHSSNADLDYCRLIRPWKLKLGLVYRRRASLWLDVQLIAITLLAVVNRRSALDKVSRMLEFQDVDADLLEIAKREMPLVPQPLPRELSMKFELG